jgi:TRAP-type C4-dicarboxylate transport system substrate-binding protein
MKLKIAMPVLAVLMFLMLTAQARAVRLKIATLSPEGSTWMELMLKGAEEVKEKTQNRVQFKFYPGGVMGSDQAVLRKIKIGQLHGGAVVAGSLTKTYPDNQIYALPLKFDSYNEVAYVRKQIDPIIIDGFEKNGFVVFGIANGGFAYVMSDTPIKSVKDLRAKKVWIPDGRSMAKAAVDAFNITPIPLPLSDVRAGLQTGLINTVTTSPLGALVLQWHTQVKYMLDVPFIYLYAMMAVDKSTFMKISPDDQKIVREVMGRTFHLLDIRNREDSIKAKEALQKQGVKIIKPEADSLKEWKKMCVDLPEKLIEEKMLSREMVVLQDKLLKEYRSGAVN